MRVEIQSRFENEDRHQLHCMRSDADLNESRSERGRFKGPILVAGAIIESGNRVLIARRCVQESDSFAGRWEFPGGTVKYGEDPRDCLVREIKEELNCEIRVDSILDASSFVYPDSLHFVVLFFKCRLSQGEPEPKRHDEVKWVRLSDLEEYEFLAADRPIIERLTKHAR